MKTAFILMAQYDAQAIIPLDLVCRDYFQHMSPTQLMRKVTEGEVDLPVTRIERSQKATRGVHLADLASWIDARREAARKQCDQLQGRR